ncbi:NemA protein [Neisseria weaveri]|uniref:NemA protein n=1 Tax=Neisseria weaveri TaxID=28091 RepID=UPI000D31DFB5|nr:NemA protein [Neisseria weaveri]
MKYLTLSTITVMLCACTAGTPGVSVGLGLGTNIGSHVGLGTSINIPVGLKNKPAGSDNSGINVIEEQIITYFDAKGGTSDLAIKGGFYRQLIKKRGNEYIVQDFYGDNSKKRTDPYILPRERLMTFKTHPINGTLTTYAYNGNIMQQQTYQNDKLIKASY